MPIIFVTVGSTYFDELIHSVLSEAVLSVIASQEFTRLIVQYGKGTLPAGYSEGYKQVNGVNVELFKFKDGLQDVTESADLVISHAGSGSIIAALRAHKPLIVVPNTSLMDNHQAQLAKALGEGGYLAVSTPESLADTIRDLKRREFSPFPDFDSKRFGAVMDETMGYS